MSQLAGSDVRPLIEPFRERTAHAESGLTGGLTCGGYDLHLKDGIVLWPGDFQLGVVEEHLCIPADLQGKLYNKSTLARMGLFQPTTIAEPGWRGYLTLELFNASRRKITLHEGQPIGQMTFEYLDKKAVPYSGRYQDQGPEPQPPLFLKE